MEGTLLDYLLKLMYLQLCMPLYQTAKYMIREKKSFFFFLFFFFCKIVLYIYIYFLSFAVNFVLSGKNHYNYRKDHNVLGWHAIKCISQYKACDYENAKSC